MKFHEFVTLRRMMFNLDQQQLARYAKISCEHVRHIENGVVMPDEPMVLYNLADALHVDREWFRCFANVKSRLFTNVPY